MFHANKTLLNKGFKRGRYLGLSMSVSIQRINAKSITMFRDRLEALWKYLGPLSSCYLSPRRVKRLYRALESWGRSAAREGREGHDARKGRE